MNDQELSDITLAWMMSQLDALLDFDEEYIKKLWDGTSRREEHLDKSTQPRNWSCGELPPSLCFLGTSVATVVMAP
jgi:hypothetical protein